MVKLFVFLSSCIFLTAQDVLLEGVSAVVGNTVILKSDVSQLVSMTALQNKIDLNKDPAVFTQLQTHALENLVNHTLRTHFSHLESEGDDLIIDWLREVIDTTIITKLTELSNPLVKIRE